MDIDFLMISRPNEKFNLWFNHIRNLDLGTSHQWTTLGICKICKKVEPDPYSLEHDEVCPGSGDFVRVRVWLDYPPDDGPIVLSGARQLIKANTEMSDTQVLSVVRDLFDGHRDVILNVEKILLTQFLADLEAFCLKGEVIFELSPMAKRLLACLDKNPDIRAEILFALDIGIR